MSDAKFKVGQVGMYDRRGKRGIPVKILEVIHDDLGTFYRVDRKNCVSESMIRALSAVERGAGGVETAK